MKLLLFCCLWRCLCCKKWDVLISHQHLKNIHSCCCNNIIINIYTIFTPYNIISKLECIILWRSHQHQSEWWETRWHGVGQLLNLTLLCVDCVMSGIFVVCYQNIIKVLFVLYNGCWWYHISCVLLSLLFVIVVVASTIDICLPFVIIMLMVSSFLTRWMHYNNCLIFV